MKKRIKKTINSRADFTFDDVIKHYNYDPDTGDFTRVLSYDGWLNEVECSKLIRGKNNRGYYWDRMFNMNMLVHRLIWLYMTGRHPDGEIDHINGVRMDNRWCNLRDVTPFENSRNQGNRMDNTSGCRGVTFNTRSNKWVSRISHKGVRHSLGYFKTKEEAVEVRKAAEIKFKYHENHASRESWRK